MKKYLFILLSGFSIAFSMEERTVEKEKVVFGSFKDACHRISDVERALEKENYEEQIKKISLLNVCLQDYFASDRKQEQDTLVGILLRQLKDKKPSKETTFPFDIPDNLLEVVSFSQQDIRSSNQSPSQAENDRRLKNNISISAPDLSNFSAKKSQQKLKDSKSASAHNLGSLGKAKETHGVIANKAIIVWLARLKQHEKNCAQALQNMIDRKYDEVWNVGMLNKEKAKSLLAAEKRLVPPIPTPRGSYEEGSEEP